MAKRRGSVLFWLGALFLCALVAVVAINLLDFEHDEETIARIRERAARATQNYENLFAEQHSASPNEKPPASVKRPSLDELNDRLRAEVWERPGVYPERAEADPDHPGEWSREDIARLAEFFREHGELMDLIRALAESGQPVYHVDFSEGIAARTPHLVQLRECARMLLAEAMVRAHEGDTEGAIDDIVAILSLSDPLAEEPAVVSQLIRFAMQGLVFEGLGSLPSGTFTPEQQQRIIEAAGDYRHPEAVINALNAEAAYGLDWFRTLREEGPQTGEDSPFLPEPPRVMGYLYRTGVGEILLSHDQSNYVELMTRLAGAAGQPYNMARSEISVIEDELDDLSILSFNTRDIVQLLTDVQLAQVQNDAYLDLVQLGSSLEAYRARTGRYPETLSEIASDLGGSVPEDPFSGQPYRYTTDGDAYTLYSVGRDLEDDGGRHEIEDGDIVWRGVEEKSLVNLARVESP